MIKTTQQQKNKILQDFKSLFLKQENCDVILKVKGQEFPAHKAILIARSPVFASMFRNDMKEKETGILDIEDGDPSTFSDFLCFFYCIEADNLSEKNVFSLFTAADKYDVPDLRAKCIEFMKKMLSIDTFCEVITLALQHNETELINFSTKFFLKNAPEIVRTVKWQSFLIENPVQSNELFIKFTTLNGNSIT